MAKNNNFSKNILKIGVIYARYSSHAQREESIEEQLRICYEYAEQNDIQIIDTYTDSAMTGTNDDRPAFKKMIEDSKLHLFNVVVMYGIDRFSRNNYDYYNNKLQLKRNGVTLRYVTQNITDDPEGELSESFFVSISTYYSKNLARNVKRGMEQNALTGKVTGKCSFGYMNKEGYIAINPTEAEAVKQIFQMYADGSTMVDIMDWLNERGFQTASHKPFVKNALASVLSNEKYIGIFRYSEIVQERPDLAIISKELFDKVAFLRSRAHFTKRKASMKESDPYILSGKLICGSCGHSMSGESATGHGGTYKYYFCKNCKQRNSKENVEKAFRESVWRDVLTPSEIRKIAQKAEDQDKFFREHDDQINAMREQLKDLESRQRNLFRAVEKGANFEFFSERLSELTNQITNLKKDIVEEEHRYPLIKKEVIVGFLSEYLNSPEQLPDFEFTMVKNVVNCVKVYDDKIVIVYNLIKDEQNSLKLIGSSLDSMVDYEGVQTNLIRQGKFLATNKL